MGFKKFKLIALLSISILPSVLSISCSGPLEKIWEISLNKEFGRGEVMMISREDFDNLIVT